VKWHTMITQRSRPIALAMGVLLAGGCATPTSVDPLLAVVAKALTAEAGLLDDDAARQQAQLIQQRQTLDAAFEADMAGRELTPAWVATHTRAYIAAREALLAHHLQLEAQRQHRRENLVLAAAAQQRARAILAKHDELVGLDGPLRQWFDRESTNTTEAQP
jgi:triphosphoribosyl-dephospho-CoA synthetase